MNSLKLCLRLLMTTHQQFINHKEFLFTTTKMTWLLSAVGRLCERQESLEATNIRESCSSRENYEAAISESSLTCASGEPGILIWTPDENTPDTVFYQVQFPANTLHPYIEGLYSSMWILF